MSEILSYVNILKDIQHFKKSGTQHGSDFNIYDTPTHKYFKILFYFGSEPEYGADGSSGFLAPTWEIFKLREEMDQKGVTLGMDKLHYYDYNSAWAFLKLNDENERAEKLEQFVTLLSDINTNSPWYFSSVSGVSEALERKYMEDGKLDMNEDKKISITCLPDAFDNRLDTLLSLYRDVTWSWVNKRQIVPVNLRKFDMAIYIFETPETNWHENVSNIGANNGLFKTSYKMIEFHDCEFNYNSLKSGWNELNNQEGFAPTFTIDISYADCYEISYNDIMMRRIGDIIVTDLCNSYNGESFYISKEQQDSSFDVAEIKQRTDPYFSAWKQREEPISGNLSKRTNNVKNELKKKNFLQNAVGQVVGHLKSDITDWVNQKLMGNIYGFSLTRLKDQAGDLLKGNIIKTGMTVAQYAKTIKNNKDNKTKVTASGNIYGETNSTASYSKPSGRIYGEPEINTSKPNGDLFPEPEINTSKPNGKITGNVVINKPKGSALGNIFNGSTLANNL